MAPEVFSYLDFRQYLREWFEWKKSENPRFSHRAFARMAGQRSPSLFLHVTTGKRNLTARTAEAFSKALRHTAEERSFFWSLVQFEQAGTIGERNVAWERISATRRFRAAHLLEGAGFEFLSHWYYPAIHELARCEGFQGDAEWIARRLRPKVTVAQAQKALDTLQALGLLVEEKGRLRARDASVVTAHEVEGLAVANYYLGMLNRAREALSEVESDERHYLGTSVAIPLELLPTLKEELNRFQERILDLCDGGSAPRDRVMQFNVQLFPLCADTTKEEP